MRHKRMNTVGSGLVWAMAVGGFLLIIVGAALTISYHYHQRSIQNNDIRQAYLTARSGAEMVVNEFTAGTAVSQDIYHYLQENTTWSVADVTFAEQMGTCTLTAQLLPPEKEQTTKQTIIITATAQKNGATKTITATLIGVLARTQADIQESWDTQNPADITVSWYLSAYTDGGEEVGG